MRLDIQSCKLTAFPRFSGNFEIVWPICAGFVPNGILRASPANYRLR